MQAYSGSFYTLSAAGVDNLNQDGGISVVRKVIEDGQVKIIMSDGRKFNILGAEVK